MLFFHISICQQMLSSKRDSWINIAADIWRRERRDLRAEDAHNVCITVAAWLHIVGMGTLRS